MKIILLQNVPKIGHAGDVKDLPDGYVRNFLLPNKLAEVATPGAVKKADERKAVAEREDVAVQKHLQSLANKLKETGIEFELSVGKDGSVFGSVNKDAILKALREHGLLTTERVEVHLEHPLKELGEHVVEVDFKKGIRAKLKIVIRAKT